MPDSWCLTVGVACLALARCTPAAGPEPAVEYNGPSTLQYAPPISAVGAGGVGVPVGPAGTAGMATGPGPATGSAAGPAPMVGAAGTAPMMGAAGASIMTGGAGMGAAGAGAAGGSAGAAAPSSSLTKLTFDYTTKTYNGRYGPKNAGVVWIEDASGKWVHTLEYWGSTPNDTHLMKYVAAKAPDYALCGALEKLFGTCAGSNVTMPPPDVITAATLTMHKAHTGDSWNLKDSKGSAVPDGMYRIVVEVAEDDERAVEIPFMTGAAAAMMPADTATVVGMKLTLQ